MKFTRRHARALATGAAATAAYLAGAKMGDSRAVRGGALLTLAAVATIGRVNASATAKTTKKRVDQLVSDVSGAVHFINHGGTVSGTIACSGVTTGGGSINTSGGSISSGSISCGGISMGGALTMNNNTAGTFSHITASQIGPGSDRAALGGQTFNAAGLNNVQARCDYLLAQLEGANICY